MPYTPPAQRSPAASKDNSPIISRSNSYVKSSQHPVQGVAHFTGPRPGLPRSSSSASYLNKERRSPSALKQSNPSPDLTPVLESGSNGFLSQQQSGSLRQSPPPLNNNLMPTGAIISPPDSTQNSSDDEDTSRGRPRRFEVDNLQELQELQAAISAIEQRRESSPDRNEESLRPKLTLEVTSPSPQPSPSSNILSPPLSKEARKISHSRSNTESSIIDFVRPVAVESQETSSDEDLEITRSQKPPMLRKKSGELVRPALRPASAKRRPSSMPGTPTYSKMVHFDNQIEHVRTFLHTEKPAAVSAGSSPVDPYDSENEFPFETSASAPKEAPWEWEVKTPNFSSSSDRKHQPIWVERIGLSSDKKFLIGTVIVRNLAFQKWVTARFTLDYWKTTSEVAAEFSHDTRKDIEDGCDRFSFNIKLADQTNLENKTLFFCVRYNVNGQEFWDSNNNMNFQVEFTKKNLPIRGKHGMQGNASKNASKPLQPPRSHRTQQRRVALPSFDDFAAGFDDHTFTLGDPPSAASLIGEKPLKFRQKSIAPGSLGAQSKANAQAFGNRYDFGASLSATKTGSPTFSDLPSFAQGTKPEEISKPEPVQAAVNGETPKPAALSEKPSLQSQSYNDLINKYCFFGTPAKSSPSLQRSGNGQLDGVDDGSTLDYGFTTTQQSMAQPSVERLENSPRSSANSSALATPLCPRTTSPFGFPFPQAIQGSLFDPQTPPAITS